MNEAEVTLMYDTDLKRPGCAILQAAFGCTISGFDLDAIGHWLTHPTPGMKRYTLTPEQLPALIHITRENADGQP